MLFRGPTQEPALATANTGKTQEKFWKKNADEWNGSVEINKEKNPGRKCSIHGYIY